VTRTCRERQSTVGQSGLLGITLCPGKHAHCAFGGGPRARDLDLDLDVIKAWGASVVVTLIDDDEFARFGVLELGAKVRERAIDWIHLPIVDEKPPDARFEAGWIQSGPVLQRLLLAGGRGFVHCRGGLGRAGTVAARILVEVGVEAAEAMRQVRAARMDAIETPAQAAYVMALLQTPP